MLRCDVCDSSNITQQVIAMVDANNTFDPNDLTFDYDDFYWCEPCDDECKPIEDGKDAK
jgi:hypothetical protein